MKDKELYADLHTQVSKLKHPNFPDQYRPKPKPKKSETNNLTKAVKDYATLKGAYTIRVNSQGQYDLDLGTHRKSGSTKGVSDLILCYKGRFIGVEIKVGKDKLRDLQKEFKMNLEKAGGIFFECRSIEGFIAFFDKVVEKIGNE